MWKKTLDYMFFTDFYWVDPVELWVERVNVIGISKSGSEREISLNVMTQTSETKTIEMHELHEKPQDAMKQIKKYAQERIEKAEQKFIDDTTGDTTEPENEESI